MGVALPGFHEREVRAERQLQQVVPAAEVLTFCLPSSTAVPMPVPA